MTHISIKEYNYPLPDERIARYPLQERDSSKLLVYQGGNIKTEVFSDIVNYFDNSHLMVFNNTRVIQARLLFQKPNQGANIEIFCLEPLDPADYNLAFQKKHSCLWKCIVGNLKKWKHGPLSLASRYEGAASPNQGSHNEEKALPVLTALLEENHQHWQAIRFEWDSDETFGDILDLTGNTPIPPYLQRTSEPIDKDRYQTVYSRHKGSVAAPTAGLHFTENTLKTLKDKGVSTGMVTLHVGAGTFKPVQTEDVRQHEMHTEHFVINRNLLHQLIHYQETVTAVGTTTLRTLESLYWLGVRVMKDHTPMLHIPQWYPYNIQDINSPESDGNGLPETPEALKALMGYMDYLGTDELEATTQIMIVPGYQFRVVNTLVTNFHQPQSTLLLLVAAFIGQDWEKVYQYALERDYRFLSYGDSSLLHRVKMQQTEQKQQTEQMKQIQTNPNNSPQ